LKGGDIVRFIKSQRIRWLGHVKRMEDNAVPKRMLKGRLCSKRRKGRERFEEDEGERMEREDEEWRAVAVSGGCILFSVIISS
jgi:hypothetical protein